MLIDVRNLSKADGYKLLTNIVTPRPIGWVTSLDESGTVNLAPFSFFNAVGSNPLFLVVSVGEESPGVAKHTTKNILATRDFVAQMVTEDLLNAMNVSAADFPEGESELLAAGLHPVQSLCVKTPRVAEAHAAMECTLHDTVQLGENTLIIGKIAAFYVDDQHIGDRFHIHGFNAIGRLGSPSMYCRTEDRFDLPRMTYGQWKQRTKD